MDNRNYEIIRASLEDMEAVRNITHTTIRAVYPKYYPQGAVDFFSAHHSDDKIASDISAGYVYILKTEGSYAGTVTISENHINRLFVLPEYQGKGFGRALMDLSEDTIFRSYDRVELDASLPAKRIYIKRGYKETEYNIIDTPDGDHLCYDVMAKERG